MDKIKAIADYVTDILNDVHYEIGFSLGYSTVEAALKEALDQKGFRISAAAPDAAEQCCICGAELDALGICKALPYFSSPPRR